MSGKIANLKQYALQWEFKNYLWNILNNYLWSKISQFKKRWHNRYKYCDIFIREIHQRMHSLILIYKTFSFIKLELPETISLIFCNDYIIIIMTLFCFFLFIFSKLNHFLYNIISLLLYLIYYTFLFWYCCQNY